MTTMTPMRIAIVGVGGVGGYFGGRLAQAGHEVFFIARGDHLAAMRQRGLQVRSIAGDFTLPDARATDDPAEVGPVDLVLVAVKGWQVREVAAAMRPLIGAETAVLPLLNGVDAPSELAETLGAEHTLAGLCRIIAYREAPGVIVHAGVHPTSIDFGELDNRKTPRLQRIKAVLESAGIQGNIPADIHVALWQKFMLVCAWSGFGAATRAPIGVWRSLPETRPLVQRCLEEVVAVARARGIAMPEEAAANMMAFIDSMPYEGTASLQRDIVAGRPSELQNQNGALVRLAREAGVSVPVNEMLYAILLPQELAARGQLRWNAAMID
ncbi:2-dehydropantoate 2-reductase [Chloroflexus sp.]|uniref:2-dehydropantoate 2-reductase n=1 Tax=Chloroflexus sp. TaxID=1904827 RepID=UPI0026150758|nr:2-dehydropantoate 2-reductase [uncultured Chloroflexus sp.]